MHVPVRGLHHQPSPITQLQHSGGALHLLRDARQVSCHDFGTVHTPIGNQSPGEGTPLAVGEQNAAIPPLETRERIFRFFRAD